MDFHDVISTLTWLRSAGIIGMNHQPLKKKVTKRNISINASVSNKNRVTRNVYWSKLKVAPLGHYSLQLIVFSTSTMHRNLSLD